MGLDKVRLQFQCPAVAGDRLGNPPQGAIRFPQIIMEGHRTALQPDCPPDVLDGHLVFARLVGNHAEKMKRIGMIRLDGENLPIDLLGRLQAAALVVLEGHRQCLGNRRHGVYYSSLGGYLPP